MTRFWVLRFAKRLDLEVPLYASSYQDQLAFTPDLLQAFGLKDKKTAERFRQDILNQIKDPDLYAKMEMDLEVEEHVLGDTRQ